MQTPGVLCVPIHQDVVQNLDLILIRCNTLFKNAKSILQKPTPLHKEILALYHDAECLDRDFICWTKNQPKEWMPTPVGTIQKSAAESSTCGYCWEGQVDNYLDRKWLLLDVGSLSRLIAYVVFVVAVWNTYRKTHVMLLEILDNCIQCLSTIENDIILSLHQRANTLIKSFVASIPYHLAPDPATFIQAIDRKEEIPPARPVGGLLLLYPLFVVAHCPLVSAPLRAYFRNCLGWIGKYMGIGQANLLSEVSSDTDEGMPFFTLISKHSKLNMSPANPCASISGPDRRPYSNMGRNAITIFIYCAGNWMRFFRKERNITRFYRIVFLERSPFNPILLYDILSRPWRYID